MVNTIRIAEMGAYVTLLEYNNIEGVILLSELSRRRIRSINKLIRVGRNEVVMVLRVDKEKGYIDLSKRRVSPDDVRTSRRAARRAQRTARRVPSGGVRTRCHSLAPRVCPSGNAATACALSSRAALPLTRPRAFALRSDRLIVSSAASAASVRSLGLRIAHRL